MTLIQAQERYIERIRNAHPGHVNRVRRSARKQLGAYLEKQGTPQIQRLQLIRDSEEMLSLELNAED